MKMMSKFLTFFVLISLMSVGVSALVPYTGAPQPDYIVFGFVEWNDQLLTGARLRITNENTGYTKTLTTNAEGYWQISAMNWLTNAAGRPPVQYGDTVKIEVLDGCGTQDTCSKTFSAYTGDNTYAYKAAARIDFSITGDLSCPPCGSCPSTSCGGGGGGSSCDYTKSRCERLYPCGLGIADCPAPVYTLANCNTKFPPKECDEQTPCQDCKLCPEEEVCPTIPVGGNSIWDAIATLMIGLAVGGYFIKRKEALSKGVGIKMYQKRDGSEGVYHKHPGIRGYHDPNTNHQDEKERHPKGELTPKYGKDADGKWVYIND